jgi:hypothetical protein
MDTVIHDFPERAAYRRVLIERITTSAPVFCCTDGGRTAYYVVADAFIGNLNAPDAIEDIPVRHLEDILEAARAERGVDDLRAHLDRARAMRPRADDGSRARRVTDIVIGHLEERLRELTPRLRF